MTHNKDEETVVLAVAMLAKDGVNVDVVRGHVGHGRGRVSLVWWQMQTSKLTYLKRGRG